MPPRKKLPPTEARRVAELLDRIEILAEANRQLLDMMEKQAERIERIEAWMVVPGERVS